MSAITPASTLASPPRTGSWRNYAPALWLLLILALVAYVRIRLLSMPLERDEGEYAYAGQLMLEGVPPYRLIYNMKMPGTYAAYALIMAVFGQSSAGIHFGFMLVNFGAIVLLYFVGRRFLDRAGAVAASAAYALLSLSPRVLGLNAHATHFVVLAALGATLALLRAQERGGRAGFFWSGTLFGLAFLMKQPGGAFAFFGGCLIVRAALGRKPPDWRTDGSRLALYAAGVAAPIVLTGSILWHAGVWDKFWWWTVTYARTHATALDWASGRVRLAGFFTQLSWDWVFWALALAGLIPVLIGKGRAHERFFLLSLLFFSAVAVFPTLQFTSHYFVLMLPVVALLAAKTFAAPAAWLAAQPLALARGAPWILFALVWGRVAWAFLGVFVLWGPDEVAHRIYSINNFQVFPVIADYLRSHSPPTASLAVLGSEPELLFYAHRRSVTGYIYMYDLVQNQPFRKRMAKEMISEVEEGRPDYVIFVNNVYSWNPFPPSCFDDIKKWLMNFTQSQYDPFGVVTFEPNQYFWGADCFELIPPNYRSVVIFQRKRPSCRRPRSKMSTMTPASTLASQPRTGWWRKYGTALSLLLILALVAVVRIRLRTVPLERDEGEYAYAGQLMLEGVPPYRLIYNMKMPGIYAAYALIMVVFGQSSAGIHLGFMLVNLGCIVLLYFVGRRFLDRAGAVAASAAYALLSLSPRVQGFNAHATHFVVLAALAATLVLLRALERGGRTGFFWSGTLFGLAFLMKQPGGAFALFGAAMIAWTALRRKPPDWKTEGSRLALYATGVACPIVLTGLILWRAGVWDKFWWWTVTYARTHATALAWADGKVRLASFFAQLSWDGVFWCLALAGLVAVLMGRGRAEEKFFFLSLLFFSAVAVCPTFNFTNHYFVLMLPVVALLAAKAFTAPAAWLAAQSLALVRGAPWMVFGLAWGGVLWTYFNAFFLWGPAEVADRMYVKNKFQVYPILADYLKSHSPPKASFAVLGSEPELLFYAHRRSVTGYIYMYDLVQPQPFRRQMAQEMISEVEQGRPDYVVFVNLVASWLPYPPENFEQIRTWFMQYTQSQYDPCGVVTIQPNQYFWGPHCLEQVPLNHRFVVIFQRKPPAESPKSAP